ncbi:MAG: hypothetical protein IT424_02755 [Pirellulales bacterium]|nr:hypothetical protein [Pirellulales bacterium]
MPRHDVVIGVFSTASAARAAIVDLQAAGWDHRDVSLITRAESAELQAAGPLDQGDEAEAGAGLGAAAGATVGLLASTALLTIPGIGAVAFAGALASGITGGLVGGLVGAMSGWGVKEDRLHEYEGDLSAGKTLVVVTGDPLRLAAAKSVLDDSQAERATLHAESADAVVDG